VFDLAWLIKPTNLMQWIAEINVFIGTKIIKSFYKGIYNEHRQEV